VIVRKQSPRIHTSDKRLIKKFWIDLGGTIDRVRRTGEVRYIHPTIKKSFRVNDRRTDVPAVIICLINKLSN
jgi:hypothetical protein